MNGYELQVKCKAKSGIGRIRPVFVWKLQEGCRQYTIEMSRNADFDEIIFLRDTRENYYVYDNVPLRPDTVYHVRVRSGLGAWSTVSFRTENSENGEERA